MSSVSLATIVRRSLTGAMLPKLSEDQVAGVLGVWRLGPRRRLAQQLRQLGDRRGFATPPPADQPGVFGWTAAMVADWITAQGVPDAAAQMVLHDVDGLCLLSLDKDDFGVLGVAAVALQRRRRSTSGMLSPALRKACEGG